MEFEEGCDLIQFGLTNGTDLEWRRQRKEEWGKKSVLSHHPSHVFLPRFRSSFPSPGMSDFCVIVRRFCFHFQNGSGGVTHQESFLERNPEMIHSHGEVGWEMDEEFGLLLSCRRNEGREEDGEDRFREKEGSKARFEPTAREERAGREEKLLRWRNEMNDWEISKKLSVSGSEM